MIFLAGCTTPRAASPAPPRPPAVAAEATDTPDASPVTTPEARSPAGDPRPYREVVTDEAITSSGLFRTHRVGEKLYFEIPTDELGKQMLILGRTVESSTPSEYVGVGGAARLFVQWVREDGRVLLREELHDASADPSDAIWNNVAGLKKGPIVAAFDIESYGPDSAAVIDVTPLYTKANSKMVSVEQLKEDRTWIEHVVAFERNIEVEATQTGEARRSGTQGRRLHTARLHWSMLKLPEDPMRPRLHDERVGFHSSRFIDYSQPGHGAESRRVIHRFRLEKKDSSAEISDPIEPIVYWIDPATPDWLKPWVERGVEAWRAAFEEAGFSNAIVARVAPTREQDPDFSLYDARRSVIYWVPSTKQNAYGNHIVDPRSGEILKGEVRILHNMMQVLQNWYFTQASPLDSRALSLPLPDSLMGRLVEYAVSHEIGHSIGFPHNMKASAMYPADSLRSASFLRRMGGHVATVMDYSRLNYVVQAEDSVPVELLIPRIGPYDRFAVKWGYKPIPAARTTDDELPTLDRWARMQDTVPWLRFSTPGTRNDPHAIAEAVGDQDAVRSSTLGLQNLQRVMALLLTVAEQRGRSYALLGQLYDEIVAQWKRYMEHVVPIVGGAQTREMYGTGVRFAPESQRRQREAVAFLNEHAFRTPGMLIDREILRRIEPEGALSRIVEAQSDILSSLLDTRRLNRLIEYEALDGDPGHAYTLPELLADLRRGVWGELDHPHVRIDVYRRNLQRVYLKLIDAELNATAGSAQPGGAPRWSSDVNPVLREELRELDRGIATAIDRTAHAMTAIHLRDLRREIARVLEPK